MCQLVFFFQAEDGIRDYKVTGVQTCALPIWAAAAPIQGDGAVDVLVADVLQQRLDGGEARARGQQDDGVVAVLAPEEAADRESGVEGKRGDLGGRRII